MYNSNANITLPFVILKKIEVLDSNNKGIM